MTDDQQWQQQQDEQRIARERAQQLETERIGRLEKERIERDQLEEEERLYREERGQQRKEALSARSAEESERSAGGPLSLLSGMFGLMRRQHRDDRPVVPVVVPELQESPLSHSDGEDSPVNDTATVEAVPIVPPMHIPGDEAGVAATALPFQETPLTAGSTSLRSRHLVALVGTALAAAAVWFYVSSMSPARLPTGLEDTPEEFRDNKPLSEPSSIAALPDPAADVASAEPSQLNLEKASSAMLGAPESLGALPQEPNAAKTLANTTPDPDLVRPGTDTQTLPQEPVSESVGRKGAPVAAVGSDLTPDSVVPPHHERIVQLEKEVEQLKVMLGQRAQAVNVASTPDPAVHTATPSASFVSAGAGPKAHKARRPSRAARQVQAPAPVEAVAPAPQYNGRLLSVDMWDGKPSVVVSTGDPGDKRVRVLQPGDSYNGITLREASVQNRNASFDVGGGKLVKLGVEE